MIITDTHTHLYSKVFDEDRNEMMQRAINAGVTRFFIPAIDSSHTESMFALKRDFPDNVFLMNGLHPCDVKENYKDELAHVERLMQQHSFCAIGEIGLDLYWDKTFFVRAKRGFSPANSVGKKISFAHCGALS